MQQVPVKHSIWYHIYGTLYPQYKTSRNKWLKLKKQQKPTKKINLQYSSKHRPKPTRSIFVTTYLPLWGRCYHCVHRYMFQTHNKTSASRDVHFSTSLGCKTIISAHRFTWFVLLRTRDVLSSATLNHTVVFSRSGARVCTKVAADWSKLILTGVRSKEYRHVAWPDLTQVQLDAVQPREYSTVFWHNRLNDLLTKKPWIASKRHFFYKALNIIPNGKPVIIMTMKRNKLRLKRSTNLK